MQLNAHENLKVCFDTRVCLRQRNPESFFEKSEYIR